MLWLTACSIRMLWLTACYIYADFVNTQLHSLPAMSDRNFFEIFRKKIFFEIFRIFLDLILFGSGPPSCLKRLGNESDLGRSNGNDNLGP